MISIRVSTGVVLLVLALVFAVASACGLFAGFVSEQRRIPTCAEDVVLVGVGSFDHGRWSEYRCGPALDDYQTD